LILDKNSKTLDVIIKGDLRAPLKTLLCHSFSKKVKCEMTIKAKLISVIVLFTAVFIPLFIMVEFMGGFA